MGVQIGRYAKCSSQGRLRHVKCGGGVAGMVGKCERRQEEFHGGVVGDSAQSFAADIYVVRAQQVG